MLLEKVLVIIPTYNEIGNIDAITEAVLALGPAYHILIVDDNSPDGTGQRVKELDGYNDRLFLMEREGKLGLGTAYIAGFKYGLEKEFEYIMEMDADFSHSPQSVPKLVKRCTEGADLCVGSRYVKGGGIKNWSPYRLMLSYGASLYVRLLTRLSVKDATAGFICYRRKVLETIDLDKITFVGYAFQIEMKYAAHSLGFSIAEEPITFKDREVGTSKMNTSIVKEAMLGVLRMRSKSYAK